MLYYTIEPTVSLSRSTWFGDIGHTHTQTNDWTKPECTLNSVAYATSGVSRRVSKSMNRVINSFALNTRLEFTKLDFMDVRSKCVLRVVFFRQECHQYNADASSAEVLTCGESKLHTLKNHCCVTLTFIVTNLQSERLKISHLYVKFD